MDRIHISAAQSATEIPKTSPGHILLIAQDAAIAKVVCADLDAAGLRYTVVRTCAHARNFIFRLGVDLILLDRMVLATAGDCWCELRGHQESRPVPVLAFSQQAGGSNVAAQAKTFTATGIVPVPGRLQSHGIILDRIAQRVSYEGKEVYLACAPFRLLEYFLAHPGRVISRGELFASLWGQHGPVGRRIDVYVGSLRKLLRRRNGGTLIQTVRGVGYIFTDERAERGRLPLRRVDGNEDPGRDAAAFRPQSDQFKLDHKGRCLQINGAGFHLSPREFAVLELLMLNPHLTLSRSVIAGCVWGQRRSSNSRRDDKQIEESHKAAIRFEPPHTQRTGQRLSILHVIDRQLFAMWLGHSGHQTRLWSAF